MSSPVKIEAESPSTSTPDRRALDVLDELVNRPLADIARELQALRQDNARLNEDVSRLSDELRTILPEFAVAQKDNAALRAAVKWCMREGGLMRIDMHMPSSSPPHPARFPPEVLLRIFRATFPPLHEHDPSLTRPWNPWLAELRLRKGFVLVCKAWSGPATAALYEDIVLWRMGQIPALARTLSSQSACNFGPLIQHLRIDSCVIWPPCADVVREDLLQILQRCTALRSLSFHTHAKFPTMNSPNEDLGWEGFNPTWLIQDHTDSIGRALQDRLWSGLYELDLSMTINAASGECEQVHMLLSAARSLHILKIGPVDSESGNFTKDIDSLPELHLPALQELQVYVHHRDFLHLVCTRWAMPGLVRLTAVNCSTIPNALLRRHGTHLTYLHICPTKMDHAYDYRWHACELADLEDISDMCPVLDHLVVAATAPTTNAINIIACIRSPTLRYLDIWCHECRSSQMKVESQRERLVECGRMPSLVKIRRLRRTLRLDLPVVCHPSLVNGDEMRLWRFPRFYVVQTSWAVIPDHGCQVGVPWFNVLSPEEDQLSAYAPSADEDDESEDGWEDEDVNEGGSSGSPYEPRTSESGSPESKSVDDDVDAEISEGELDVTAFKKQRLSERFDRDTILAMFETNCQNYGVEGEGEEGEEGD